MRALQVMSSDGHAPRLYKRYQTAGENTTEEDFFIAGNRRHGRRQHRENIAQEDSIRQHQEEEAGGEDGSVSNFEGDPTPYFFLQFNFGMGGPLQINSRPEGPGMDLGGTPCHFFLGRTPRRFLSDFVCLKFFFFF